LDIDAKDNERKVTPERIKLVDKFMLSPEERSLKVYKAIAEWNKTYESDVNKIDNWDLLCYSVSHIVAIVNVYPWLREPAKMLKNLVFNAHYLYPQGHGLIKEEIKDG
jgi:hypothetical protein